MCTDVLDPARCDLSDEYETSSALVPLEIEVCTVLLYTTDYADEQLAFFRPKFGFRHMTSPHSRTSMIVLPDRSALPPAGLARVAPQMAHEIEVDALSKTMAS
jgi:hypothetical protein